MTFNYKDYLREAEDSIETAELLLKNLRIKATINRAYYGVFYCAQALLLSKEVFAKTHSGLKSKFSEYFIKTGIANAEISKKCTEIFEEQLAADYDMDANLSVNDAEDALLFAKEFFQFTQDYFTKK